MTVESLAACCALEVDIGRRGAQFTVKLMPASHARFGGSRAPLPSRHAQPTRSAAVSMALGEVGSARRDRMGAAQQHACITIARPSTWPIWGRTGAKARLTHCVVAAECPRLGDASCLAVGRGWPLVVPRSGNWENLGMAYRFGTTDGLRSISWLSVRGLAVVGAWLAIACGPDDPTPKPTLRSGAGQLPVDPAIVCNSTLQTELTLHGTGFFRMPFDPLHGAGITLPSVDLVASSTRGTPGSAQSLHFSGHRGQPNFSHLSWQSDTRLGLILDGNIDWGNQKHGAVPLGVYDVTVENPDRVQTEPARGALAVVPLPSLSAVAPGIVCLANGGRALTVQGAALLDIEGQLGELSLSDGAHVTPVTAMDDCSDLGHGIIKARSCKQASVWLADSATAPGYASVTLRHPRMPACASEPTLNLRIVPAPAITRVAPVLGCIAQGEHQFTIEGSGFLEIDGRPPSITVAGLAASATLSACTDLPTSGHAVRSCNALTLTVPPGAVPSGSAELVVKNPEPAGCSASSVTTLTLAPPPVIDEVQSVAACIDLGPRSIQINGSGFLTVDGVIPIVQIGEHIVASSAITPSECTPLDVFGMNVQTCNRLSVSVAGSDLPAGAWSLSVTNPDPARCDTTSTESFTVVTGPTLTAAAPAFACSNGEEHLITLRGANLFEVDSVPPSVTFDGTPATVRRIDDCTSLAGQRRSDIRSCSTLEVVVPRGALLPGRPKIVVTNPEPIGCETTTDRLITVPPLLAVTRVEPSNLCVNAAADSLITVSGTGMLRRQGDDFGLSLADMPIIPARPPQCAPVEGITGLSTCSSVEFTFNPSKLKSQNVVLPSDLKIVVENPAQDGVICRIEAPNAFRVVGTPSVSTVTPNQVCSDVSDTALSLHGDGLAVGADVIARNRGTGLNRVGAVTALSAQEQSVIFSYGLLSGPNDLSVINAEGCSQTIEQAVLAVPSPKPFWIDPPTLYQGMDTNVMIFVDGLEANPQAVELVDAQGVATSLSSQSLGRVGRMTARVPKNLGPGRYDLRIASTNGCSGVLADAITITGTRTLALAKVEPVTVSPTLPTSVTLNAPSPLPVGQSGFQGAPRIYLVPTVSTDAPVALRAVKVHDAYTAEAIVPENTRAGKYDLVVVNRSGEVGVLNTAVTVSVSEPPKISAVVPSTIISANGAAATILGRNFETSGTSSVNLLCRDLNNVQTTVSAQVGQVQSSSVSFTVPAAPSTNTVCTVELVHSSGASAKYSSISFRASSGEVPAWQLSTSFLVEPRRGLSLIALGPDANRRYLYALGGDNGSVSVGATPASRGTPKASIEFAQIGSQGELGTWTLQRNSLPAPRTQAGVVAIDRFVYVVGGHDGATATNTLLRAQVLDPLAGPEIVDVDAVLGDAIRDKGQSCGDSRGLEGGRWQYRVAAVYPDDDPNNPAGQSLPGDALTLELPETPSCIVLKLTWPKIANVSKYRLYRSASPGGELGLLANENRITCGSSECQFEDNGTLDVTVSVTPLPPGSLGTWKAMGSPLNTAREGLAVAAVADPQNAARWYLYAFGGRNQVGAEQSSYEWARVELDASANQTLSAFSTAPKTIGEPKSDLAAWVVDKSSLRFLEPSARAYVYVGAGSSAGASTVELAHGYLPGSNGGELVSLDAARLDLETMTQRVVGAGAGSTGSWLYLFGGVQFGTSAESKAPWAKLDPGGSSASAPALTTAWFPGDRGLLNVARAYLGSAQDGATFFVAGGYVSSAEPAARSVEYAIR